MAAVGEILIHAGGGQAGESASRLLISRLAD
jgi:hypothetical protein